MGQPTFAILRSNGVRMPLHYALPANAMFETSTRCAPESFIPIYFFNLR